MLRLIQILQVQSDVLDQVPIPDMNFLDLFMTRRSWRGRVTHAWKLYHCAKDTGIRTSHPSGERNERSPERVSGVRLQST